MSIITTCMGRLEHLKQSLPAMLAQDAHQVVVVDYACPDGTAAYVEAHFPQVMVVKVEGEEFFSNWKARNAGAQAATGDLFLFCDADTVLAPGAATSIADKLPPRSYGYLRQRKTQRFNTSKRRLGMNQLRGFHAIPAAAFRRSGGYDALMRGYASGADTEIENRLQLLGLAAVELDPAAVQQVIEHGNAERVQRHRDPIRVSYATGFLYRKTKIALMRLWGLPALPEDVRERLYKAARDAAARLAKSKNTASLNIEVSKEQMGMPRQLGFQDATFTMTLSVSITGTDPIDEIPE